MNVNSSLTPTSSKGLVIILAVAIDIPQVPGQEVIPLRFSNASSMGAAGNAGGPPLFCSPDGCVLLREDLYLQYLQKEGTAMPEHDERTQEQREADLAAREAALAAREAELEAREAQAPIPTKANTAC